MYKKILMILSLTIILNFISYPQVKDVKGWSNFYWGMNKLDVIKLYPNLKVEKSNTLVKERFVIDNNNFEIIFLFDSLKYKLHQIILRNIGHLSNGSIVYKLFRKKLITKYGVPVLTEEPKIKVGVVKNLYENFTTLWSFPSSTIELQLFPDYPSRKFNLEIIYSENIKSEKL